MPNEIIRRPPENCRTQKKKRHRPFLFLFLFLCIFLALAVLFLYAEKHLSPEMRPLAVSAAQAQIDKTVDEVLAQFNEQGKIAYDELVSVGTNADGRTVSLSMNAGKVNEVKTDFCRAVSDRLAENGSLSFSVPLGSLSEKNLFSGKGFPVKVKLSPAVSVSGEIESEYEPGSFNQFRHAIWLNLSVAVTVILPGDDAEVHATHRIPLCENLLFGAISVSSPASAKKN